MKHAGAQAGGATKKQELGLYPILSKYPNSYETSRAETIGSGRVGSGRVGIGFSINSDLSMFFYSAPSYFFNNHKQALSNKYRKELRNL